MLNQTIKTYLNTYIDIVADEDVRLFESISSFKKFSKGDSIINYGRPTSHFYILKKGIVGCFTNDRKGKEFIRTLYIEGNPFGDLSTLIKAKSLSNANYKCLTDSEVYEISCEDFIKLRDTSDNFSTIYIKVLETVCLRLERKIDEISFLNATERYTKLTKDIPDINNLLPQYQIASYLNITPVQLSRIRKNIFSI